MPVPADRISVDGLRDLREVHTEVWGPPGAGDARLAVDYDVPADQAGRHCRSQGEDRGSRVAARYRHQTRPPKLSRVELWQPEDGLGQQVWRGVLLVVPAGIEGGVGQTEVGAHVDDPRTSIQPRRGPSGAHVVREAAEDDVDLVGVRLLAEGAVKIQQREDCLVALAGERARGELCKLHARMPD